MASIGESLSGNVAGMPVWVWGAVVVAGIGVAYVLPKLHPGTNATPGANNPSAPTSDGTSNNTGIGLAVDPTTGLPYAVTGITPGIYPAGAFAGQVPIGVNPIGNAGTPTNPIAFPMGTTTVVSVEPDQPFDNPVANQPPQTNPPTVVATGAGPNSPQPHVHTVLAGEYLTAIAKHAYGSESQWHRIYEANRATIGANPNVIHPGMQLVIP